MLFIVVYCRPMVGEVGHHNMHIIGKPRLCENSIWCLDPRVRIRIRYGSGSENYGSGATLRPTNSVKALKGKHHIPWNCLPQAHLEVFQLCLWPLIAPGYLGGGLPCISSALWCQHPSRKILLPLNKHRVTYHILRCRIWQYPNLTPAQSEKYNVFFCGPCATFPTNFVQTSLRVFA